MAQITKIREAIQPEKLEEVKDALTEIETALEKAQGLQDEINDLQKEKVDFEKLYREAIRDTMKYKELQAKATAKADELENKLNSHAEQLTELEELRNKMAEQKAQEMKVKREGYEMKLKSLQKSPAFEKVKDKLFVPTDGNPLDTLEEKELDAQLAKLNEWEELGVFKSSDTRTPENGAIDQIELMEDRVLKAFGHRKE